MDEGPGASRNVKDGIRFESAVRGLRQSNLALAATCAGSVRYDAGVRPDDQKGRETGEARSVRAASPTAHSQSRLGGIVRSQPGNPAARLPQARRYGGGIYFYSFVSGGYGNFSFCHDRCLLLCWPLCLSRTGAIQRRGQAPFETEGVNPFRNPKGRGLAAGQKEWVWLAPGQGRELAVGMTLARTKGKKKDPVAGIQFPMLSWVYADFLSCGSTGTSRIEILFRLGSFGSWPGFSAFSKAASAFCQVS